MNLQKTKTLTYSEDVRNQYHREIILDIGNLTLEDIKSALESEIKAKKGDENDE